jgi:hypothetical protein
MPDAETHRQARAQAKARRNAGRQHGRRERTASTVAWEFPEYRRCTGCGKWLHEGQVSGFGGRSVYGRLRWCEDCHLSAELRRASVRALMTMHSVAVTGAA